MPNIQATQDNKHTETFFPSDAPTGKSVHESNNNIQQGGKYILDWRGGIWGFTFSSPLDLIYLLGTGKLIGCGDKNSVG